MIIMIEEENAIVYSAECDICKVYFEDPFEGWTVFLSMDNMIYRMDTSGWHREERRCYCPKCHEIDDEDNLIFKAL